MLINGGWTRRPPVRCPPNVMPRSAATYTNNTRRSVSLFERLVNNPRIYAGAVVAKVSTCVGSLIWGTLVILFPGATTSNKNYEHLLRVVPNEDVWGVVVMSLAAGILWRLVKCKPPLKYGFVAHGLLSLFWTYLWWGLVMGDKLWPAGISAGSVLMLLSIYAFVSNPKRT